MFHVFFNSFSVTFDSCCGVTVKPFWSEPSILAFKSLANRKTIFEPGLLLPKSQGCLIHQLKTFLFNSYTIQIRLINQFTFHRCQRERCTSVGDFGKYSVVKKKTIRDGELKLFLCNLIHSFVHSFKMKPSKSSPVVQNASPESKDEKMRPF